MLAGGRRGVAKIKLLVNAGAALEATDRYGMTPLHVATQNEHVECVKCLVKLGASQVPRTPRRVRLSWLRCLPGSGMRASERATESWGAGEAATLCRFPTFGPGGAFGSWLMTVMLSERHDRVVVIGAPVCQGWPSA